MHVCLGCVLTSNQLIGITLLEVQPSTIIVKPYHQHRFHYHQALPSADVLLSQHTHHLVLLKARSVGRTPV